jgi:hypothetical protein
MLTLLTSITTFISSVWSKTLMYVLLCVGLLSAIMLALRTAKQAGMDSERAKQDSAVLKTQDEEAKANAKIDSLPDANVRDQLRKRWSEQ